jgi:hypothetical protein
MLQTPDPFFVTVVRPPAQDTSLQDLVLGSLGIAGGLLLSGLVLGLLVSAGLILWRRFHRPESDHLPPVTPLTRVSSQVR